MGRGFKKRDLKITTPNTFKKTKTQWDLAGTAVEHKTLDLGVVSLSPTLGVEMT